MTINSNKLRITELDFENIKSNLKDFLSSQDTLSDYNFEGSALSVMVDLLAYNTMYNSVLANMVVNERFLDTAVSRSSVVSIAKQYDYYPQSYSSSTAVVDITVNSPTGNPSSLTLQKNTTFSSVLNGTTFQFVTDDNYEIAPVNGVYKFSGIPLKEGSIKTYSYLVDKSNSTQKFIIPDINVDISTLKVYVQNSVTDTTINRFYESKDITSVKNDSKVFFIQGSIDNKYEIYFGDGIIGTDVADGSVVILEYIICNGDIVNNMSVFKLTSNIAGNTNVAIRTITPSNGGKILEDIDSIRKNAVKSHTTQNRLVSVEDYKTLLPQLYPNIKAVSVWGGDENVPPDYGSVYISIEPTNYGTLNNSQKTEIVDSIIKNKKIISVSPVIVDPQYVFMQIHSTVYYDKNVALYDPNSLKLLVKNTIASYNNNELMKFDGVFRYSKLSSLIDATDKSILSNITTFKLHQYVIPNYGQTVQYVVQFNNPIYKNDFATPENSFSSSGFMITGDPRTFYLEDDGNALVRMFYISNSTKIYYDNNVGTVNYVSGTITFRLNIASFIPFNIGDPGIQLLVETQSNDVVPVRNMILRIKDSDIFTDAISDEATGNTGTSSSRIFTSSR